MSGLEQFAKSQGCDAELLPVLMSTLSELAPSDLNFFNEFVCTVNTCYTQANLGDCISQLCCQIERDMATLLVLAPQEKAVLQSTVTAQNNATSFAINATAKGNTTVSPLLDGVDIKLLNTVGSNDKLDALTINSIATTLRSNINEENLIQPSIDCAFVERINEGIGVLLLHSNSHSDHVCSVGALNTSQTALIRAALPALLQQHQYVQRRLRQRNLQHRLKEILRHSDLNYSYWLEDCGWTHVNSNRPADIQKLLDRDIQLNAPTPMQQSLQSKLSECKKNQASINHELIIDEDNSFKVINSTITPLTLPESSVNGLSIASLDITKSWLSRQMVEKNSASDRWLNGFLSWVLNQGDILVIEQSLEIITKHFGVNRCYIRTFENLAEEWTRLSSWHTTDQKSIRDEFSADELESFLTTVKNQFLLHGDNEICLEDLTQSRDHPVTAFFLRFNLRSVLMEPMVYEGEIKGYLGMASVEPRHWTHQEKRTLKICAETFYRVLMRLQLLEQLKESEERFDQAMEISSSGIWVRDLNKKEMYFSPSFFRMLGYEQSEISQHPIEQVNVLIPEDERKKLADVFNAFYRSTDQDEIYHETPHIKKDGSRIWIAGRGKVVKRNSKGYPMIVIGANTDISAIQAVRQSLIQARVEAEKANLSKGEFLARMSHEIRTPMNAIIGMSYLLGDTRLNEEQQGYVEDIEAAASALLNIIDDILDFSKIEAGKLSIEYAPFNLHQELQRIIKLIGLKVAEKSIAVKLDIDNDVPTTVVGDRTRFGQVVTNLLSNAVKFTQEGEISLSARMVPVKDNRGSITMMFSVSDTGIGLTEEQTAHLFKPYQQAEDSTNRKFGGTGLGLAICKNLVELMGGNIEAISVPNAGTTFLFSVMFKLDDDKIHVPTKSHISTNAVEHIELLKNKSILLVEDNQVNQRVAQGILQKIGMKVVVANNGKEALEKLSLSSSQPFAAVLMDIEMPVLDGLQTTKLIRSQSSHFQTLPIIAMTAHAMSGDKEKCHAAGMNAHIAKPINPTSVYKVLVEQIQQYTKH